MLHIDDSEIDLDQVKAKLSDFECERNTAREALRFVKQHAVFPLGIVHASKPGSPWDIVNAALDESNTELPRPVAANV